MSASTDSSPVSAPSFLTIFKVSRSWRFPERVKPENYPGLLLWQRLRGRSESDLLLIWWTGREAYRACGPDQLRKDLNADGIVHDGAVIEELARKKHWWQQPRKFMPWAAAILGTIVGVLGNLSQLETFGAWLIAPAGAEIFVSPLPVRCIQNEERVIEFKIHNTSTGTSTVTNLEASPNKSGVLIMEQKLGPLAPLTPGELRSVSCQVLPKAAGKYTVRFSGEIRSGRARSKAILAAKSIDLEVWPALDERPDIKLEHAGGTSASFLITARHGKPPTKRVRYQATGPENLTFIDIDPVKPKESSKPGQGPAVIVWEQEATPLEPQKFTLYVSDKAEQSLEKWKEYEKQITITTESVAQP